jgi:hypothetical protein
MRSMTVSGRTYQLDQRRVEDALEGELPEPIREHYVIVNGRRWPPKQVLALVTGLDRADFTTHQARSALTRLGFPASRARHGNAGDHQARHDTPDSGSSVRGESTDSTRSLADALRPFAGQWVAIRGTDILVAAPTPADVVAWLTRHGQRAQSMFRVPGPDDVITGAAPA